MLAPPGGLAPPPTGNPGSAPGIIDMEGGIKGKFSSFQEVWIMLNIVSVRNNNFDTKFWLM